MADSMNIKINITDNSQLVASAFSQQVMLALELCGQKAEDYAKLECPVASGMLRNSIAHGVGGETPSIGGIRADNKHQRTFKDKGEKVYIGTAVEYGQYVEFGSQHHKTGKAHFLRDAIADNVDEYKQTIENTLKAE